MAKETRRRKRREYTAEFKRDAVALMERQLDAGRTLAAIARDLGVVPQMLQYWADAARRTARHEATGSAEALPTDVAALQVEVKRLQRELARVEQEREFLKKAAAFFAKESP